MKYLSWFISPISRNLVFFTALYILGVTTTILDCVGLNFKIPRFNFISYIFDLYIVCLFVMVFPQKVRTVIKIFISAFSYILSLINTFCVEVFHARIGPEILNVVLETNQREASEFAEQYLSFRLLSSGVGIILLLLLFHGIIALNYDNICRRWKQNMLLLFGKTGRNIIIICMSSLVLLSFYVCGISRIRVVQLVCSSSVEEVDMYINNYSENTPLNHLLYSIKMRQLANKGLRELANSQLDVKIDSCSYVSNNIVLIVGESYIRSHSQLYGYKLPTTPRQVHRTEKTTGGCLIPFSNVVSPSNLTSIVFKNSFSLHSMDDSSSFSKQPLFPVLFKKVGYQVTFITNQFVPSLSTDIFNFSGGLFLNEPKLSHLMFSRRNTKTHKYDLDLLADYDSLLQFKSEHQLTIFHLAGQHIYFDKRFPSEYKKFVISDYTDRNDLSLEERQTVADYDNATLYNDFVVDSILRAFEKEDAVVIYMPDHGEECYDEIKRVGRMPGGNYAPEVLRQEYRIPFWIWCSKRYIDNHPQIFNQIKSACNRPFMTDDLPHLLLYLAGIHCKYYSDKRCLISDCFDEKRKRLIVGQVDYDKIVNVEY